MLDFRIHTFLVVCKTMNFTRAAEELHITQPAVSQHIKYLENLYSVKLFASEGKKLALTESGRLLRSAAVAVRNDDSFLREQLAGAENRRVPMHFGVTMTIGEFLIAEPLAKYLRRSPETDVCMEMNNTEALLERLRAGQLHFALVEGYFDRREFESVVYGSERFVAVCSAKHRFETEPRKLSDLLNEKVIARESGSGTRDILEKHLTAKNLSISDFGGVVQIGSMQAILHLVAEDIGISFMYERAARQWIDDGKLRELYLSDFTVSHDFAFIWEKGSINAEKYREICENLRK